MNVPQTRVQCSAGAIWAACALAGAIALMSGCGVGVSGGATDATAGAAGHSTAGGAPGGGASGGTSVAGNAGTAVALDCTAPRAAAVPLQLLSADQYDYTVLDLLQVGGDPGKDFGDNVFEGLDDTRVEQRANAAAAVAQQAVATLSKWSPCAPPATGDASACEGQIIDQVGANAFRHPLSTDERAQMKTLFDAGIKEKDFSTGVEWFLTGVLQSPDFMYQIVKPAVGESVGQTLPLAPYEYASRVSYFLWNSMPDSKLFAAAAADELSDPAKRQVHLARMIADARFTRGVQAFYSRWLNVGAFSEVARDAAGFTGDVVTALSTSLLMSATQLYSSPNPNFSSLLSGDTYYLNDTLRTFYGIPGSGTAFAPVEMTGQGRQGILTHPALMALLARPQESFPISRGLFMVRTLMCGDVPPPPVGLDIPELPPIQDGLTTRDRLTAHVSNALCNSCHHVFDPPGFALENFDEVGKYRTIDHGKAVDSSGTIAQGTDLDGDFANGGALLTKMASSTSIKSCFAQQYLKFALSRQGFLAEDACSAKAVGDTFAPSGDLKQLVVSVIGSDAFRLRLAEGVAQ
jgi:Protein of unknown function (DUF1588)/Protein of unknown function (DUF1592)/Protein of unknown function (DUF1595)